MDTSHTLTDRNSPDKSMGGDLYVTTDGLLRYCITAPLLELPHDFKEWYRPNTTEGASLVEPFSYQQNAA